MENAEARANKEHATNDRLMKDIKNDQRARENRNMDAGRSPEGKPKKHLTAMEWGMVGTIIALLVTVAFVLLWHGPPA
jgi:hypothetical protein